MVKIQIDLKDDPLIPAGRNLIGNLVGAHLSAVDEEELLHMVGVALSDVHSSNVGEALRIVTHAAYHAQELIVRLLDIAAERGTALEQGVRDPHLISRERLRLWAEIREDVT